MEDLQVIGVEDGALVVTSERGDRYRIEIDEALTATMRQAVQDSGSGRRLSPKEIQAHIRSGMSAQDVASITGVPIEYIQRFEGPILAEREFVIGSALAVPVHTAKDTEFSDSHATFGSAILARLHELSAVGERWASWKEESNGWVVKLSFTADQIDHDARWRFDPKKSSLAPINAEAEALSRQGELTGKLIPRLRAVDGGDRMTDSSRFDSGAFVDQELADLRPIQAEKHDGEKDSALQDTAPHVEAIPFGRVGESRVGESKVGESSHNAGQPHPAPTHQTADLLDALRRRRGEREAASFDEIDDAMSNHPSTGSIRLVDVPRTDVDSEEPVQAGQSKPSKRGRATMPSWDEIVFGARSDDDPA